MSLKSFLTLVNNKKHVINNYKKTINQYRTWIKLCLCKTIVIAINDLINELSYKIC